MQQRLWPVGKRDEGSYSLEGAITITVFTICMMAIISIILILRVELEVQGALNQTAMEFAKNSYAIGKVVNFSSEDKNPTEHLSEDLLSIFCSNVRSVMGQKVGAALAENEFPKHFSRKNAEPWLVSQGIENGFSDFDFSQSRVLSDGKTISLVVSYPVTIQAYGLFHRTLQMTSRASVLALLPENASLLEALLSEEDSETSSIWKESNFTRGKYFLSSLKKENLAKAVAAGQGIDLYDATAGIYVEGFSLNIFSASYADCHGNPMEAGSYVIKEEALKEQVFSYGNKMKKDISSLGATVKMESGVEHQKVEPKTKKLVLFFPMEAKEIPDFEESLQKMASEMKSGGVLLEIRYEKEALV